MYKTKPVHILIASVITMAACTSNEIGDSKDVAQDKIYQDYSINYTEGDTNAEIYCQFRFAGKNGTTLVLNAPSQVQVDGEKVPVDSSTASGAFYRVYKPGAGIFTTHQIVYTNTDNKKMENNLSFSNFKLTDLPATVSKKQDLKLAFETPALQSEDYIEVEASNTDSSFSITHVAADKGNFIIIPAKELKRQKVKEFTLEATLYRKIPLQQGTSEGGQISTRFTLKPVKVKLAD